MHPDDHSSLFLSPSDLGLHAPRNKWGFLLGNSKPSLSTIRCQLKGSPLPASALKHHFAPLKSFSSLAINLPKLPSSAMETASNPSPSRYEAQKRRDWNTFSQYLNNHRPPLPLPRCTGAHVLDFLRYLDQFGKTKVHIPTCPFYGLPNPPAPCTCPLRQAWGSLDALIGRLRAAFEENGGRPESNPFGARAVRIYLREVREMQSKARGISYDKKKRRKTSGAALR